MRIINSIRFLAAAGLLCFYTAVILADTNYVVPPGTPGVNPEPAYLTWATAATNIYEAVNAASNGNTVLVTNGTYCLTNQVEIAKAVTVRSVNGWTNTLVGYEGNTHTTRCFYVANSGIMDGFTVSNGRYWQSNDYNGGGGAWVGTATIQNCYFLNNSCSNQGATDTTGGGGAYVVRYGIVSNCIFYSNATFRSDSASGGGLYCRSGRIYDCTFISNYIDVATYQYGIGICIVSRTYGGDVPGIMSNCLIAFNAMKGSGNPLNGKALASTGSNYIYNCVISNNSVSGVDFRGGSLDNCVIINNQKAGVQILGSGTRVYMTNCIIDGNRESGLRFYSGTWGVIDNCVIRNNIYTNSAATNYGAGCKISSSALLRNCLICNNTNVSFPYPLGGGGLYVTNSTLGDTAGTSGVYNCTIVNNWSTNDGGGVYADGPTNFFVNCVIASNFAPTNADVHCGDEINTNNFYYSCVNTNLAPNQGNITNDPLFANAAAGNWRLANNSPCINTGTNISWMTNAFDLDGRTRIRYGTVDMGAYEKINEATVYNFR